MKSSKVYVGINKVCTVLYPLHIQYKEQLSEIINLLKIFLKIKFFIYTQIHQLLNFNKKLYTKYAKTTKKTAKTNDTVNNFFLNNFFHSWAKITY